MKNELPHSPAVEAGIIAGIIGNGPEAIATCLEHGVSNRTFYCSRRARVFNEVIAMHGEGKAVDIATIAEHLKERGLINEVGGWPGLAEMTSRPPFPNEFVRYCKDAVALEGRRKIIRCCGALKEAASRAPDDIAANIAELLLTQMRTTSPKSWVRVVDEAVEHTGKVISGEVAEGAGTLGFGFPDLDSAFQPMRRGELSVIAARPSLGKSSFMREVATYNALTGANVMIVSLEVSADDIAHASAATRSKVNRRTLPRAHPKEQRDYIEALNALRMSNLHVFDSDRSVAAITARAKAIHASRPLDLIAIDYLGLISDCEQIRPGENKAAAVGRVSKALKSLAMELNCVVMLLSQLNRQSVTENNREPRLTDLRDSGDIEQDADRVILIHRPSSDPLTCQKQNDSDELSERPRFFQNLIQAKGRNVGTGIVSFYFRREFTCFEEISRDTADSVTPVAAEDLL